MIAALGFGVALAGDATHVASGTTVYETDVPELWRSAIWFPFLVSGAVLLAAWSPSEPACRLSASAGARTSSPLRPWCCLPEHRQVPRAIWSLALRSSLRISIRPQVLRRRSTRCFTPMCSRG